MNDIPGLFDIKIVDGLPEGAMLILNKPSYDGCIQIVVARPNKLPMLAKLRSGKVVSCEVIEISAKEHK